MNQPKKSKPRTSTPVATPPNDLSDWRGFNARAHRPQFGSLAFLALVAVVSTAIVSRAGAHQDVREVWMFSLVFLQLLVVDESDEKLSGPLRWIAPLATALAVPALVYWLLGARPLVAACLAGLFLAVTFVPRRWLDKFDAWRT